MGVSREPPPLPAWATHADMLCTPCLAAVDVAALQAESQKTAAAAAAAMLEHPPSLGMEAAFAAH